MHAPRAKGFTPKLLLRHPNGHRYVAFATAALRASRLNAFYPDAGLLTDTIGALDPALHGGLYGALEVNRRSGLPTTAELDRAREDIAAAEGELRRRRPLQELIRRAAEEPGPYTLRELNRSRYYHALRNRLAWEPGGDSAVLRRRDSRWPEFRCVVEDVRGDGTIARATLLFAQQRGAPAPLIETRGDQVVPGSRLRALRNACLEEPIAALAARLQALQGVRLEQVIRGVVGPFLFPGLRPGDPLEDLLGDGGGGIGSFALEIAAADLTADAWQDPLEDPPAGPPATLYRSRERKFVCPARLQPAVEEFCRAAGTRNVVYTYPP